jgi:hypothetical protein
MKTANGTALVCGFDGFIRISQRIDHGARNVRLFACLISRQAHRTLGAARDPGPVCCRHRLSLQEAKVKDLDPAHRLNHRNADVRNAT